MYLSTLNLCSFVSLRDKKFYFSQVTFAFEEVSVHTSTITWMKLLWQRAQQFPAMDQALYTPSDGNYGNKPTLM